MDNKQESCATCGKNTCAYRGTKQKACMSKYQPKPKQHFTSDGIDKMVDDFYKDKPGQKCEFRRENACTKSRRPPLCVGESNCKDSTYQPKPEPSATKLAQDILDHAKPQKPESTVLTLEQIQAIVLREIDSYYAERLNPIVMVWIGSSLRVANEQDAHTRQLLPDELRAQGWKSPEDMQEIVRELEEIRKLLGSYMLGSCNEKLDRLIERWEG